DAPPEVLDLQCPRTLLGGGRLLGDLLQLGLVRVLQLVELLGLGLQLVVVGELPALTLEPVLENGLEVLLARDRLEAVAHRRGAALVTLTGRRGASTVTGASVGARVAGTTGDHGEGAAGRDVQPGGLAVEGRARERDGHWCPPRCRPLTAGRGRGPAGGGWR